MRALDRRVAAVVVVWVAVSAGACLPRVAPLTGTRVPAKLPETSLRSRQQVTFRWEYEDTDFRARGDGLAVIATPDSARIDLWADGGFGGGYALIFGDSVRTPGNDQVSRYLPPPAFFWAAMGWVAVQGRDTVAYADGGTLEAEIGPEPRWHVRFDNGRFFRLERVTSGRLAEWVVRDTDVRVRYKSESHHRSITISEMHFQEVARIDSTIWR